MPVGSFISGQVVPASGIYCVRHSEHRLPHEVTLLKDQRFPPCARCGTAVQFKVVRVLDELDEKRERIVLHAIPELPEEGLKAA